MKPKNLIITASGVQNTGKNDFARHACLPNFIVIGLGLFAPPLASAATINKANNAFDLNLSTSWTGGVVPGTGDVVSWNSSVTGANSVLLGANLGWKGISLTNPGGAVTIGAGNTLTLGTSGIDMSAATQDLTISSGLTIGSGRQVWNVASGRTLTLNTGTFTRSAGATLNLQGTGTVAASMTGLANTNGILGPWFTVGTGAATRYATLSGGNVISYTGATLASTTASAWGGIPSGGTGTINYEVSIAGTPGLTGLNRNINTLLYTGSGMTQGGNTNALLLNANGIMNSGTGTLVIGGAANQFSIAASSTTTNEMVLAAANAAITINATMVNNLTNASSVTVTGPGTVTLVGNNTFTGDLTINSGTLAASTGQGAAPTSSNLGALQPAANRNITVNDGGTLSLTGGNVLGTGGSTNTLSNTTLVVNSGGLFQTGLNAAGTGWWNKIGATNLNGGTIRVGSGANNTTFQGLALIGTVTVGGISASTIENQASSNSTTNGVHLGQNATASQSITFNVADVTGSTAADLTVSAKLLNTSANLTASGLTKTGAGTMLLTGNNAYTGGTVISAGTLQIGSGGTTGSLAGGSAITNNAALVFDRSDALVQSNAISGSGTLTKNGGGTLTLSGANTYTGATAVNAGTIAYSTTASSIGSLTVADSAGLSVKTAAAGTTPLTTSSLTLGTAGATNLTFDFNNLNPTSAQISTGALSLNGTISVGLSGTAGLTTNTYKLIDYTGALSGSFSALTPSSFVFGHSSGSLVNNTLDTSVDLSVVVDNLVWSGAGASTLTTAATGDSSGSNDWATKNGHAATNFWANDAVEFNDTYDVGGGSLAVSNRLVNITGGNVSPSGVAFNNSAGDYTVSSTGGFGFAGAATLTKNGTGKVTLTNVNAYTGGTNVNSGTLELGDGASGHDGTIAGTSGVLNNATLAYNTFGSVTAGYAISGTGAVVKNGAGNVTLSGANSYSGGTTINSGSVTISANNGLGTGALTLDGGTLTTTNSGTLTNTHAITVGAGGGTLNINSTGSGGSGQMFFNTANSLLGSGTLTVTGNGTLSTTGAGNLRIGQTNTYNGNLVAQSGGIIEYGVAGAVAAGATFTLNNQGELSLQNATTLGNAVTVSGGTNSVLSFENGNTGVYSGAITLNAGVTIGLRDWYNYATVRSGTISSGMTGAGGVTVNSGSGTGGTLTLTGANAYTGTTTITSSVLQLGNGGATGSLSASSAIVNNGTLVINRSNAVTQGTDFIGSAISGTGGFTVTGTGPTTLNASNTFTGTTTVNTGATLALSGNNTLSTGNVVLNNGATLRLVATAGNTTAGSSSALGSNTSAGSTGFQLGNNSNGSVGIQLRGDNSAGFANTTTGNSSGNVTLNFDVNNEAGVNGSGPAGNVLTFAPAGETGRNSGNGLTTFNTTINASGGNGYSLGLGKITGVGSTTTINAGSADISIGSIGTTAGSAFTFGGTGTTTVTGAITNATGVLTLTKTGAGTTILGGNNSYTGATTVNGGKLVVNGNISTSVTTVNTGATLGGSGTVGGLIATTGGNVAPGNSPGVLSAGNTDLQSGSTLTIELDGTTPGIGGHDQLNVTGTVSLAGALSASLGYVPANGDLLFILANDGTDDITGTFSGLADNSTFNVGGQDFQISYFGDSAANTFTGGNDVVLMAIPEPGAVLLGSLGVLALLRRRRSN